MTVGGKVAIL